MINKDDFKRIITNINDYSYYLELSDDQKPIKK